MKKNIILSVGLFVMSVAAAQESTSSFTVLKLPVSSHAAGLGGENVSVVEDTPWVGWANPALYSVVSDRSLGLDFMSMPAAAAGWVPST